MERRSIDGLGTTTRPRSLWLRPALWQVLATLWGLGLVYVLGIKMPTGRSGKSIVRILLDILERMKIPEGDKWVHLVLFGVLAGLLVPALRGKRFAMLKKDEADDATLAATVGAIILSSGAGAATELMQALLPTGRAADALDWMADTTGAALAASLMGFVVQGAVRRHRARN